MKKRIILFLMLVGVGWQVRGQLNLGDAVVTNSGTDLSSQVVKIVPAGNTTTAVLGNNWPRTYPSYPNWTCRNLGQVFGICINTNTAAPTTPNNPLIYVSVAQIYPKTNATYDPYAPGGIPNGGQFMDYGEGPNQIAMPAGTPLIWELNPATGVATALVLSDPTGQMFHNDNKMFNRGTGLGNICFDPDNNQIFATNFEDGRIYRIDANPASPNYGDVLSRWDPFDPYPGCTPLPCASSFAIVEKREDRLWGIGYSKGRLYFSRWVEDLNFQVGVPLAGRPGANQVWSVGIHPSTHPLLPGDFMNPFIGAAWDYTPAVPPTLEVDLTNHPVLTTGNYSNPIADIEFSLDGSIMLLAERTMSNFNTAVNPSPNTIADFWAHKSRLIRYDLDNMGMWIQWSSPWADRYLVGQSHHQAYDYDNCDGGTDFGYINVEDHSMESCEGIVWATGDALKHGQAASNGGNDGLHPMQFVYGITGIPVAGNDGFDATLTIPCNVLSNSPASTACPNINSSTIFHDIFTASPTAAYPGNKSQPGDIDVFRKTCHIPCEELTEDDIELVSEHVGGVTYTFHNGGDYPATFITWSVDGTVVGTTTGTEEFEYTFTEGTHVVCMEAAFVETDDMGMSHCCYFTDCEVFHIRGCELWKATADFDYHITTTDHSTVTVDYDGFLGDNTWGLTIIWDFGDNTPVQVTDGTQPVTHTYTTDGTYEICATVIWSLGPWDGSNPEACCCVTEICKDVVIAPCNATFELVINQSLSTSNSTVVELNPPLPSGATVAWAVDGGTWSFGGTSYTYYGAPGQSHTICARITAGIVPPCFINVPCLTFIQGQVTDVDDMSAEENEGRLVKYYPNPTKGIMVVELQALPGESASIEVFDYLGRSLLQKDFDELSNGTNRLHFSIDDFANGIYQMKVTVGGETKVVKVVKN